MTSSRTRRKSPTRIGNRRTGGFGTASAGAASRYCGGHMTKIWMVLLAVLLMTVPGGFSQGKKKGPAVRSVTGVVTAADDKPVFGAMVQLKDTKTKNIRSFTSQENGTYYFQGLSPDVDYELSATFEGASTPIKTLSTFDSRKEAVINLKLGQKK
jgi:hypothetical protein